MLTLGHELWQALWPDVDLGTEVITGGTVQNKKTIFISAKMLRHMRVKQCNIDGELHVDHVQYFNLYNYLLRTTWVLHWKSF